MSADPYHAVQQEIQASLQAASQLRASYARIRSTAREESEELIWARNELKATLASLEADLEDLDESVRIVESGAARAFGLDDAEVRQRRQYVEHVRREIESMRTEMSGSGSGPSQQQTQKASGSRPPTYPPSPISQSDPLHNEDEQGTWAREEQQLMMREQDQTMEAIAGTLGTLAQQASLMGREIGEQVELLDDLEQGVDRTDTKLSDAMRRMRRFLRQSEERGSGWCIVILIIVLIALLLAVILV
ncbi:snare protein TLG1/Syntaxin [Infundibulicybe gibba]|nr:snare protein TLG1/Syntaxin [Infundibulicybe gibba]KAF8888657.1 snare protein TLG1/Syntaxin [Infundibulicybe gibba]